MINITFFFRNTRAGMTNAISKLSALKHIGDDFL